MSNSNIIYFCPAVGKIQDELESIQRVTSTLAQQGIDVTVCPNWADLMVHMHDDSVKQELIVFRLDYLERNHMQLDEVLSMLSSLTKFVAEKKKINIAVVVPEPCCQDLILKLKRNNVLGIIPGMRFFDPSHAIEAYKVLAQGQVHWPSVAINSRPSNSKEVQLTKRQYEIFNLVARRGLTNKKIAQTLDISEDTVKAHVGQILKLYGVRNRTQLALANETGIIR